MQRICNALADVGYRITLVGRRSTGSAELQQAGFRQKRLPCFFNRGKLSYIEFNCRLFFYLLFKKIDAICAIDLDTIVPCYMISAIKKTKRVYDAHELFTEMKEVISRPAIKQIWMFVEKKMIPKFSNGYTVSESIAEEFKKRYGVSYHVIRNVPLLDNLHERKFSEKKFILYQGAVNEARGLEYLIPAMQFVRYQLLICGDGNMMKQCKQLVSLYSLGEKVVFLGMLPPDKLSEITYRAYIGVNLVENYGLNQYYSLANKFFDYIHAGIPQLTMDFPEYKRVNDKFKIAALISELDAETIAAALNNLLDDDVLYKEISRNCMEARKEYNWNKEKIKLIAFYQHLFSA
ncbi:MAG: glycosyltransferase [Bacteroidetes bacterium]|nr:glycosyltransferase [Bacteroidota bacterium]